MSLEFEDEVYPLSFSLDTVDLTESELILDYVNKLQDDILYEVEWQEDSLNLRFNGIWKGIGLPYDYYQIKDEDEESQLSRVFLKGASRSRKVSHKYDLQPKDVLKILQEEGRGMIVDDIIGVLDGIRCEVKTNGDKFIGSLNEDDSVNRLYVSRLLSSWWLQKRIMNESVSNLSFWECCTFDGTVLSHISKIKNALQMTSVVLIRDNLKLYFPHERYPILNTRISTSVRVPIRFTDYIVKYVPCTSYVNVVMGSTEFMHLLPHYGIVHKHWFKTVDDLRRYLEWSVYRSQQERNKYRNAISFSGIRFTRGGKLQSDDEYLKFLNFLLFHSLYLKVDLNYVDSDSWHQYLMLLFKEHGELLRNEDDPIYELDGACGIPNELYDYLRELLGELNESKECSDVVVWIEEFLSNVFINPTTDPVLKIVGRDQQHIVANGIVKFSELPSGDVIQEINDKVILFSKRSVVSKVVNKQLRSVRMCGRMYGVNIGRSEYDLERLSVSIETIKNVNKLRVKMKEWNKSLKDMKTWWLNYFNGIVKDELEVSFGEAILCAILFRNVKIKRERRHDSVINFELTGPVRNEVVYDKIINFSTPKICSVLSTFFDYMALEVKVEPELLFRKVLLLGGVGDGDPIGYGLFKVCNSSVIQIGAMGVNSTIRAQFEDYEFSQGFSAVISDMETSEHDVNKLYDYFTETLVYALVSIVPDFVMWKVNYGSYDMLNLILHVIVERFSKYNTYRIMFIRPMYASIMNKEVYLCMLNLKEKVYSGDVSVLTSECGTMMFSSEVKYDFVERPVSSLENCLRPNSKLDCRLHADVMYSINDVKLALSVLLHSSAMIALIRSSGSNWIRSYCDISLSRLLLTSRSAGMRYLMNGIDVRYSIGSIPTSSTAEVNTIRICALGDFIRVVTRLLLLRLNIGLNSYNEVLEFMDDNVYVGIGDDRANNIMGVPTNSPYIVIDPRVHMKLRLYNIAVDGRPIEWELDALQVRVDEISELYPEKRIVIFALFMLYNDDPTHDDLIARIRLLFRLMDEDRRIRKVYFNVYLEDPFVSLLARMEPTSEVILYDDIRLFKNDTGINKGTFGVRYDPVCLVKFCEIEEIADGRMDLIFSKVKVDVRDISRATWLCGNVPSLSAMSGVECGYEFSSLLEIRRRA